MLKRPVASLTLVIGALLFFAASHADVVMEESFEHYLINPSDVDQIKIELRKNSPVSRDSQTFHGGTEWTIVPHFRWRQDRFMCRIKDVEVQLNGVYTMPRLISAKTVSDSTRQRFEAYYAALLSHEKGHQALWLSAAKEIEKMLSGHPPHESCQQLATIASGKIQNIIARYREENRAYDRQTGYGRTQGAVIR